MPHPSDLESLTPAQKAAVLAQLRNSRSAKPPLIQKCADARPALSFGQEQLWLAQQVDPDSAVYNLPARFRVRGNLDARAFSNSLRKVVERHEVLRTVVRSTGAALYAELLDARGFDVAFEDLRDRSATERDELRDRRTREEALRPFDLTRDYPIRCLILRFADDEFDVALTLHHIAADGWSVGILMKEAAAFYGRLDDRSALAQLTVQYADYAAWARKRAEAAADQLAWWKEQLDGAEPLRLPAAPILHQRSAEAYIATRSLGAELALRVRQFCRDQKTTVFMLMLATYEVVLWRYTGQADFVVGAPIANRSRPELEPLIGYFVNLLPLRARIRPDMSIATFVDQTRETVLSANARQDVAFERLANTASTPSSPLPVAVTLTVHNNPVSTAEFSGLRITPVPSPEHSTRFDIELHVTEEQDDIRLTAFYRRDPFGNEAFRGIAGHLATVLDIFMSKSSRALGTIPLLTSAEIAERDEWNRTDAPYPRDATIAPVFIEQVERRPDAVAVRSDHGTLSYRELHLRALHLASYLRSIGVMAESRVAVMMPRSDDLIGTLLGIIYAGAAYVAIDPLWPVERCAQLIEQSSAACVITTAEFADRLPMFWGPVVNLDVDAEEMAGAAVLEAPVSVEPTALAYISFTSGSTGVAKAVGVTQRNVLRLVKGNGYVRFDENCVFAQYAPVAFDASTFEIWGALLNGATLAVAPSGPLSISELGGFVQEHGVTTMWLTAGLFHQVAQSDLAAFRSVCELLAGGDRVLPAAAGRVLSALPDCRLVNGYGPTEATTFACTHTITCEDAAKHTVPIGRPIANTHVYVLDRSLCLCPSGIPGELYIGGDGVARGYVNAPDLTAERFVPDPFSSVPGDRMYRTGDIVRQQSDGIFEFIGRTDSQVKVRGFRVEPDEVAAALCRVDGVADAVVVAREGPGGENQIWAYVVTCRSGVTDDVLRTSLAATLPGHLLPSGFVYVDSIPLTANGKPDRHALPAPQLQSSSACSVPRDVIEFQLMRIWEEMLGCHSVSLTDDFFAIGGSSLSAVRVIARIEERFGLKLPLVTMFRYPIVSQLADRIRDGRGSEKPSCLVRLNCGGSRPPLFLVHPAGGNILCFTELAREIARERPLYAFQCRGLDPSEEPFSAIPEMALHYVELMRQVQPEGPYFLAGLSMGGMVAYEMARILEGRDLPVAFLGVIDSGPLSADEKLRIQGISPEELMLWRVENWNAEFIRQNHDTDASRLERVLQLAREAGLVLPDLDLPGLMHLLEIYRVNAMAHVNYIPDPCGVPMTLFRAAESIEASDRELGWTGLARGGVEVVVTPGRHETLIGPGHAAEFARELDRCLDTAEQSFCRRETESAATSRGRAQWTL